MANKMRLFLTTVMTLCTVIGGISVMPCEKDCGSAVWAAEAGDPESSGTDESSEIPGNQGAEAASNTAAAENYLNTFYRDGEAGTEFLYGSDADRVVLDILAEVILEGDAGQTQTNEPVLPGSLTDADKALAISEWVRDNILYIEEDGKAMAVSETAIDTFYNREGRCFGIAQLISQLIRLEGIPAAVGVGRRSQEAADPETVRTEGFGHAWVYVYDRADQSWSSYIQTAFC